MWFVKRTFNTTTIAESCRCAGTSTTVLASINGTLLLVGVGVVGGGGVGVVVPYVCL